ncbi:L,D-transpeptidase family protein [Hydrotalea sp.]|uniref:L,D-transpeptidase family protein n=1 Tax=Hydrotalea sp. TaxID=2881279 RepID=UPI00260253F9|nr:L,D-transpeptidase family protein [Hydrotalea sp.]
MALKIENRMRVFVLCCVFLGTFGHSLAQASFVDFQKTNVRVANAFKLKEDTLARQFKKEGLSWPPRQLYIRSFKYDSQLEVWARNNSNEPFKLIKTYKICALSGGLGPKRIEGDYQVPEGFYYINLFNPKSTYYLSLGLNYPNVSDQLLSDSLKPGSDIFIHGTCVTVGCIPIMDNQIDELYLLASYAKSDGEDFIPVHIYPVRFNNPKSAAFLDKVTKDDKAYASFTESLEKVYHYFEKHKTLPVITVNEKGKYVMY